MESSEPADEGAVVRVPRNPIFFRSREPGKKRRGEPAYVVDLKGQALPVKKMLAALKRLEENQEVAEEMAKGVKELSDTDIGLSTTGIAGPGGGTEEKPVGLVYIGLSTPKGTRAKKFLFRGDRWENKSQASAKALEYLCKYLARQ